jgi:hypothetical protein
VYFQDITVDDLVLMIERLTLERFISVVVVEKAYRSIATLFLLDLMTSKWSCGLKIPNQVVSLDLKDKVMSVPVEYICALIRENIGTLKSINFSQGQIDNSFMEQIIPALEKTSLDHVDLSHNPDFTSPELKQQLQKYVAKPVVY